MMKKIIILLLFPILLLSGCNKLPSALHDTEHLYPKKLRSGTHLVNKGVDLSYLKWWKKLHDSTLNRLMMSALNNNTQLKSSWHNIQRAKAQLQASYAAWLPTITFNPRAFAVRTWGGNLTPLSSAARNTFANLKNIKLQGYLAGFVPDYSLNIMQNMSNDKMAKASLSQAKAIMQMEKLSVISQMIGSYFMLSNKKEQLVTERQYIQDEKQLRDLEKVRFNCGANDIDSVVTVEQTIAKAEENIPRIKNSIAQNENAIRLLINKNPGPVFHVHKINFSKIKRFIPSKLSSTVLKNRPDLNLALDQVNMAAAQVGASYSAFFPTISLTNLIGSSSIELVNLLKASPQFWLGQLVGAMNLLNLSAYRQIKAAKATYYSAYYEYIHTLRSVFVDVDNALTSFKNNYTVYEHCQKAFLAAQQKYYLSTQKYQAGAKDYRLVLNAKINLDTEKLNLIQQKAQVLDSLVKVYQSLGGGYNTLPSSKPIKNY